MLRRSRLLVLGVLSLLALMTGCSEEESIFEPDPPELQAEFMTVQPRSVLPGEIAELAAVVSGFPGANYNWSVSDGTLIGQNTLVVSWKAPSVTGRYTATYRVDYADETGSTSDQFSRVISVNGRTQMTSGGGLKGWHIWEPSGTRLYFLHTPFSVIAENFGGFTVRSVLASDGSGSQTNVSDPGYWHTFNENVDRVAYFTAGDPGVGFLDPVTTIYYEDLPLGAQQIVATPVEYPDEQPRRRDILSQPNISSSGDWIAYTRYVPDTTSAPIRSDSIEVFTYHVPSSQTTRITVSSKAGQAMPVNNYATVSPNEDYFLHVREANNRIHLWSYPILNDTVSVTAGVRLTDVSGQGMRNKLYKYSPDGTKVAYIGRDGFLYTNNLVGTAEMGGGSPDVTMKDFVWSPDNVQLAVVVTVPDFGDQIFYGTTGAGEEGFEVAGGFLEDTHFGVTWSADASHLHYYVSRLPDLVWAETYDIDQKERISMSPHASFFQMGQMRSLYGLDFEFRPSPDPTGSLDVIYTLGDLELVDFDIAEIWKSHY